MAPALPRRLLVDLPGQALEERIFDDLLVEGRILAAAPLARVLHEELALGDAGRAEGVGLDDVGAGLEKTPVDVAEHLGLRHREDVAVVEQVLGRVLEAVAAGVALLHPVGADGRSHRPVDDDDALAKQLGERVIVVFVAHERSSSSLGPRRVCRRSPGPPAGAASWSRARPPWPIPPRGRRATACRAARAVRSPGGARRSGP
jgi:hypothetical protein